ncbi:MAG: T9SS type A sorting domain-containing protein [Bacteroidota bacterium]
MAQTGESPFGSGDQASNTATRTGVINFSPFAVAKGSIPLPIRFGDIKAVYKNHYVQIDWYSLTEMNVDHYEIERSTDGRNFILVGQVAASGNSISRRDYSWIDNIATDGIFFYRVIAVDADQKSTYSNITRINVSQQTPEPAIILYPNPVAEKRITVQAGYMPAASYRLAVYDQAGREVYQKTIEHTGGTITQQVQLPSSLSPGLYNLSVNDGRNIKLTKSFVIK